MALIHFPRNSCNKHFSIISQSTFHLGTTVNQINLIIKEKAKTQFHHRTRLMGEKKI